MSEWIWQNFERLVVIDTETTGIDPARERVIELAAIAYGRSGEEESFDLFVSLPEGRRVPPFIVRLTGITDELLAHEGVKSAEAAERLVGMLSGPGTLLAAYNAQFDLCFIYYLLKEAGMEGALRGLKFLDALTVYRDRRPYPHKLENAVEAYGLAGQNTHRAVDDAAAAAELLEAMSREKDDLMNYVNLFGYNPKFGVPKPRIGSITYRPQQYDSDTPPYEEGARVP